MESGSRLEQYALDRALINTRIVWHEGVVKYSRSFGYRVEFCVPEYLLAILYKSQILLATCLITVSNLRQDHKDATYYILHSV